MNLYAATVMGCQRYMHACTAGILQGKPIQSAKYCNLIGWSSATEFKTELVYIVKCPQ